MSLACGDYLYISFFIFMYIFLYLQALSIILARRLSKERQGDKVTILHLYTKVHSVCSYVLCSTAKSLSSYADHNTLLTSVTCCVHHYRFCSMPVAQAGCVQIWPAPKPPSHQKRAQRLQSTSLCSPLMPVSPMGSLSLTNKCSHGEKDQTPLGLFVWKYRH